ncbi:MAG: HNH endonuclease signature motif containing protein [Roseicyclus sp.]
MDHIAPLRDGGAPFDLGNLQTLCPACHARKTRIEVGMGQPNPAREAWKMGDPSGRPDRADEVRPVRKSSARWAQEVLRAPLRGQSPQAPDAAAGGQRGHGGDDCDQELDLTARCRVCGVDMWPCDSRKVFCSPACIEIDRRRTEAAARIEELARRSCLQCGEPIPLTATRRRVYCSDRCARHAYWEKTGK